MQTSISRLFILSAALLLINGCAGRDFVRVTDDALMLGKTTKQDVAAKLGSPYQQGVVTKNEKQLSTASYAYSSSGSDAAVKGVTPARSQGFYFLDDILVGHEFTSSFKADSTDFDGSKVSKIKKGVSKRGDVIGLLGQPGGKYRYPLIPVQKADAFNYVYSQTSGSAFNLKFYQKLLVVTFDKSGVVTNVEFTESGQK